MAAPLAPLVGTLVRWFLVGIASSLSWKLGSYMVGKTREPQWKDMKYTWTGRAEHPGETGGTGSRR